MSPWSLDAATTSTIRQHWQPRVKELTGMQYELLEVEFVLVVDKVRTSSAYFYTFFTSGRRFGSF